MSHRVFQFRITMITKTQKTLDRDRILALLIVFSMLQSAVAQPSPDPSPTLPVNGVVDIRGLGAITFPNSGAQAAQDSFHQGVLLLHSFEYARAAEAFREAQELDSGFALAYWGEAMTHNHPLWRQFDRDGGNAVLMRLATTPEARRLKAATERERLYLDAVETLFSFEGSKQGRDRAYMEAMQRLHEAFPGDDEATSFYALSILGIKDGARDFATYMRAAATVMPVFERNPRHPGAAHYIIHSFDDPVHASLGLRAANAYSEIAPDAAHAQHMTSHIFVALGMWERTVTANVRARDIVNAALTEEGKNLTVASHYVAWLHYAYLQLGETEKAEAMMDLAFQRVQEKATVDEWEYFVSMRARQIVDTGDWSLVSRWTVPLEQLPSEERGWGYGTARFKYLVTDALAGLYLGNGQAARALTTAPRPEKPGESLQIDQLAGLLAIQHGKIEEGVILLHQAADAEDALPLEFGPPELVKPSHEVLGKALVDLGRMEEASTAFRRAMERTPRRTQAVNGLPAGTSPDVLDSEKSSTKLRVVDPVCAAPSTNL